MEVKKHQKIKVTAPPVFVERFKKRTKRTNVR